MLPKPIISRIDHLKVVVLTGAGISAESGLKTFRDNDGLWEQHRVEDVATPEAFKAQPDVVYRFYQQRREQLFNPSIQPNQAHLALAKLEKRLTHNFTLVTQNVDNLHQRAGSHNVLHMHGNLLTAKCLNSGQVTEITSSLDSHSRCSCCQPSHGLRPNIVWFGEIPYFMPEIEQALAQADLFIAIGTSGTVYPAAGFVAVAKQYGAHTVELNLEPSVGQSEFNQHIYGPATTVVSEFVEQLLEG
ncbi:Sir2 family NAD+-dependent deacetylase [Paraglaciecola aestuariivivens]